MNRIETLNAYITAAEKDIAYCNREIAKLTDMLSHPVNAGYAKKEIAKTESILRSHNARLEKYSAELLQLESQQWIPVENCHRCHSEMHQGECPTCELEFARKYNY